MRTFVRYILLYMSVISCNSRSLQLERRIIGTYTLKDCLGAGKATIDSPILTLDNKMSYTLAFQNKTFTGRWKAYCTGDNELIEFYGSNRFSMDGLGQGIVYAFETQPCEIVFVDPSVFFDEKVTKVSMVQIKMGLQPRSLDSH